MRDRIPVTLRLVALLPSAWLASACSGLAATAAPELPQPESAPLPPQPAHAGVSAVIMPQPLSPAAPDAALARRVAELELDVLERNQQIAELHARLDDARREVVRSMARQQSLATRAEAASGMAEAELALKSLPATVSPQAAAEIRDLMTLSSAEFDKTNFGGALYLANQAKSAATAARGRPVAVDGSLRPFERRLVVPLNLATRTSANVRAGPGTRFEVLFTLPAETAIVAYSSAEQWLQITDDAGRRGWISQSLIRGRL